MDDGGAEARARLPGPAIALLALALLGAVAWPLVTYTVSLAAFGLPHVLAELRYLDRRFGRRIVRRVLVAIALGGVAITATRIAGLLGAPATRLVELSLGVLLVVLAVPRLRRSGRALALVVAVALVVAIEVSPAYALLALAVLHNLTPLGFVADATRDRRARRAAAIVFMLVPALVLVGWPWRALWALGVPAPEATWLFPGPLQTHMHAYLPDAWLRAPLALHAFSACVFLQCAHYLYVIAILPRTLPAAVRPTLPWPPHFGVFLGGVVALSLAAFVALPYLQVRAWYGTLAALHAWVELPILLLALTPRR